MSTVLGVIDTMDRSPLSDDSATAIDQLQWLVLDLGQEDRDEIDIMFKDAVSNMIVKLTKDFDVMTNIDKPDDYVLPMTNRSNVGLFNCSNLTSSGTLVRISQAHR